MSSFEFQNSTDWPYWSKGLIELECINVIQQTPNVKSFQFISHPQVKFHFKPGQFIALQMNIEGRKVIRSYTISSSPSRPLVLEITVKKDPDGEVSLWLHENMHVGSKLSVRGPNGIFNCWDEPAEKALMLTAGSGITPCMSMSRWWFDSASPTNVVFFHSAQTSDDIIFKNELEMMATQSDRFQYHVACTRQADWSGLQGHFSEEMLKSICPDYQERIIYCCGPEGFMDSVKSILEKNRFNMDNYFDESFGGAKQKQKPKHEKISKIPEPDIEVPRGMFALNCGQSQKTILMDENDFILEKANQEGVFIDSGCHVGNCGTCRVKLISGEVEMENDAGLDEESRKQGYILTCTTRCKTNVVIDI